MTIKIPTKRFGRTEVQMPVLTCGGMRYQQAWEDCDPAKVEQKNQKNIEKAQRVYLRYLRNNEASNESLRERPITQ